MSTIPFDSKEWKLVGSSKHNTVSKDGNSIVIESGPKTDWWRTAVGSDPESNVNRSSGPLYYLPIPSDATHWKAGVWISGSFEERFQQATIFLGVGDYSDQGAWAKAGIEVEDEQHNVG
jgi:regulation of enolase protein 1 (concanavalin A-like superfamily)